MKNTNSYLQKKNPEERLENAKVEFIKLRKSEQSFKSQLKQSRKANAILIKENERLRKPLADHMHQEYLRRMKWREDGLCTCSMPKYEIEV